MTTRISIGALSAVLAAGLVTGLAPAEGRAALLSHTPQAVAPSLDLPLVPVAEKKKSDSGSSGNRNTVTKQAAPKKQDSGGQSSPRKSTGGSSNTGGGSSSSGGSASGGSSSGGGASTGSKIGGTKTGSTERSTGTTERSSGTTDLRVDTPSKTKTPPPDAPTKGTGTQERVVGKTPLDDPLGLKTKPEDKEAPLELGATPPEEGTTYTTQDVTQEELDAIAESEEYGVEDVDGDGDYEKVEQLPEGTVVTVEGDVAYIDSDGDGNADYVVPADIYDPDTNTVNLPISTDSVSVDEEGNPSFDEDAQGYVWYDSDGDGVDELYRANDTDADGVADAVDLTNDQGLDGMTKEEVEAIIAEQGDYVFDVPGTKTEDDNGTGKRPRVNVGLTIAPSTAATTAPAASSFNGNDVVVSLQQLKLLRDQGVLTAVEHDNAQLRALADVNPQKSGVEGGLSFLRQLWDQRLITESPYARKRQELLDAL